MWLAGGMWLLAPIIRDDSVMIWAIAAIALLLVLVLYRRMLSKVTVFVPARTHLTGWRRLDVSDGSDTWAFLAFVFSFVALLFLDWPFAIIWLVPLFAGMEVIRRLHNNEPASV